MKISLRSIIAAAILPLAGILPLCAQDSAVLTDSPEGIATGAWGTSRAENYDVAVHVGMPQLENASVSRIAFPMESLEGISDARIWLSRELTLENKVNVPDIVSMPASYENGSLTVTLAEPVAIGAGGIYVGMSFNVDSNEAQTAKKPVETVSAVDDIFGAGFWVHTSKTYGKWRNIQDDYSQAPLFSFGIAGLPAAAVEMEVPAEVYALSGEEVRIDAVFRNYGSSPVGTMAVSAVSGDKEKTVTTHFSPSEGQFLGYPFNHTVLLPAMDTPGSSVTRVALTKVNGNDNLYASGSEVVFHICSFRPVNRPLFEEYTGTGCGYCPRGALGMERLQELFGDRFVGVAYHCSDIMSIATEENYPNYCPAQPDSYINRFIKADPWFGQDSDVPFDIERVWKSAAEEFAPVSLGLSCYWKEEEMETVCLRSDFTFVRDYEDAAFEVVYILAANGLKGSGKAWAQGNYYSGNDPAKWPEEFSVLIEAPNPMTGQVYNDVAIAMPYKAGVGGSVPSTITRDRKLSHTFEIPLATAVNLDGESLVQSKRNLYGVAAIVDTRSGRVVNAARCDVPAEYSGICGTSADEVETSVWYDLRGQRLAGPVSGEPSIRVDILKDGTARSSKCIRR